MTIWIIWVHFYRIRTNLKIWPVCKKVNDLLLFWSPYQQRKVGWIFCNWLFCSSWPKEHFDVHHNWNHFDYSKFLYGWVNFDPPETPPCSWFQIVSTLGMQPMVQGIHPHRTRFYIIPVQFATKCWGFPPRYYISMHTCFNVIYWIPSPLELFI